MKIGKTSTSLFALITERGVVTFCNGAFGEIFRTQLGHKLQKEIHSLIQEKNKLKSVMFYEPAITLGYCSAILRTKPFIFTLHYLKGSNPNRGGMWLLQATPKNHPNDIALSPRFEVLSSREREICHLVREGSNNNQIAIKLFISPHTVNQHFKSIHRKLGTHSRPELVYMVNQLPKEFYIEINK